MKTILVDAINGLVVAGEGIYRPMFEILESCPNPKIILTNADDAQMIEFGLNDMPYPVFTLKHQPDKVEPEYYLRMLEHFGLHPEGGVYFEHNADAVKSAQSVGIPLRRHVRLNPRMERATHLCRGAVARRFMAGPCPCSTNRGSIPLNALGRLRRNPPTSHVAERRVLRCLSPSCTSQRRGFLDL